MNIGIAYYSRTGNTRQIAHLLEEKLTAKNAEVAVIEIEHIKRPGFFSAGRAAIKEGELPIKNTDFDVGRNDVLLLGCPTWAGKPSPFITTFINKAEQIQGKKVAVFSTGMSPIANRDAFKEQMKNTLNRARVSPIEPFLMVQFKKDKLVDGQQHIDTFIATLLK